MAAHATPADLLERYDADLICDLLSDDKARLARIDIPTNAKALGLMVRGSGAVEVAMRAGKRYMPEVLEDLDTNSTAHLKDIVCAIVMSKAFRRRPLTAHQELADSLHEEAEGYLDQLRKGINVFGVVDDEGREDAGVPSLAGPSSFEIDERNFLSARMSGNHVPLSRDRNPRSRG